MWKGTLGAVLLVGTVISGTHVAAGETGAWLIETAPSDPQPGYITFCENYPENCAPLPAGDGRVELTATKRAELEEVNDMVNRHIEPVTDLEKHGVSDYWEIPEDLRGDCEAYVLTKRKLLMEMGWPAHALLITVVLDEAEGGHAVLSVATAEGDLILDNLEKEIRHWHETPYRYVRRQSVDDPNQWAALREPAHPDVPVAATD